MCMDIQYKDMGDRRNCSDEDVQIVRESLDKGKDVFIFSCAFCVFFFLIS